MRRFWLLSLVLTLVLSSASAQAQAAPTPEAVALHAVPRPSDGLARRRWSLLPGKLAVAMVVTAAAVAPSNAAIAASAGFALPAVMPLYMAGPLGAAWAIHAIERRHGGVSRYRGAAFGTLSGSLIGAIGAAFAMDALGVGGDADFGKAIAVGTAGPALGASVFGVLGDEISSSRQRMLRKRRVAVSASFAPLRGGGLAGSLSGRF